ncbi:MAG: acylneuraminate cytidylyltransferase [Methyloprofundus sp.]|nr:acylneuraminate cytidylyltransferase [Methyloprofundus sp.]
MNILVIIPARGGSKGIPRKNLRALAGNPLIYYSIKNALSSKYQPDVYVSSEDSEILSIAQKIGAKTIHRNINDAEDATTLDPVIHKAWQLAQAIEQKTYDLVVTLQPTSPLLKVESLDKAIDKFIENEEIDTVISAVNDTHLTWKIENSSYKPNYAKRVNRQQLPPVFKETGGFLITRASNISENNRIGKNVDLFILSDKESIDIDNYADWGLCEYYLKRKRLLFVVSGYQEIGLGHVYNTLLLANDIVDHEVLFLVDDKSQMAFDKISSKNYPVYKQAEADIVEDIKKLNPDIVINDMLDTDKSYIQALKAQGFKVINFEDLGSGAKLADLTINAIYPEDEVVPNHYFGYKYFVLRDEFILTPPAPVKQKVSTVLLSFGGVDPNNYTQKVLSVIYDECQSKNIKIKVVTGFGYQRFESLESFNGIEVYNNVQNISDYMRQADLIFTSAGRTTYEIASLAVPAIVLAQNERELTHFFANAEHGFVNLGLGTLVDDKKVLETFVHLVESVEQRQYMSQLMSECDLVSGRNRVVSLIKQVINT